MQTKPILSRFCWSFGTLRFHVNSFFKILLGVVPYWDNKVTISDNPGTYNSEKMLNSSTMNKTQLK